MGEELAAGLSVSDAAENIRQAINLYGENWTIFKQARTESDPNQPWRGVDTETFEYPPITLKAVTIFPQNTKRNEIVARSDKDGLSRRFIAQLSVSPRDVPEDTDFENYDLVRYDENGEIWRIEDVSIIRILATKMLVTYTLSR